MCQLGGPELRRGEAISLCKKGKVSHYRRALECQLMHGTPPRNTVLLLLTRAVAVVILVPPAAPIASRTFPSPSTRILGLMLHTTVQYCVTV